VPDLAIVEQEIQRLVRIYKETLNDIIKRVFDASDIEKVRLYAVVNLVFKEINDLDEMSARWASSNIRRLFRDTIKETTDQLRGMGALRHSVKANESFSTASTDAVRALMMDPESGFIPNIYTVNNQLRFRIRSLQTQTNALRSQQRLIDETIARVGVLEGKNLNTIKQALLRDLIQVKDTSEMVWKPRISNIQGNSMLKNLSEIPYVKTATIRGERLIRLDKYVEMVARTKTAQAVDIAKRLTLMKNNQTLVLFTLSRSKWEDACDIFVGRVFSLSQSEASSLGIAYINELPSGGIPLHPNCTHSITVYFDGLLPPEHTALAMTRPPEWALNRNWGDVEKQYRSMGGIKGIMELNPAFKFAANTGGWQRSAGAKKGGKK